jgi:hypothetical protein
MYVTLQSISHDTIDKTTFQIRQDNHRDTAEEAVCDSSAESECMDLHLMYLNGRRICVKFVIEKKSAKLTRNAKRSGVNV